MRLLLVTPTGDRHASYKHLEWMLARQTDQAWDHLVIDDGAVPTPVWSRARYIRREPSPTDPPHTLCLNLLAALDVMREYDVVAIVEDDDFYSRHYVKTIRLWLGDGQLVGEADAKYYHLQQGFRRLEGQRHVSLCRCAFRASVLDHLERTLIDCLNEGSVSVDMWLWKTWRGSTHVTRDPEGVSGLSVAVKGMPGRPHLARKPQPYQPDPDYTQFRAWLRDDEALDRYKAIIDGHGVDRRPVVYQAVFGGYDAPRPPRAVEPGIRYVRFTDQTEDTEGPWEVVRMTPSDGLLMNRMLKILAHRWFADAPWSIYLDGCYEIVRPLSPLVDRAELLVTDSVHDQWSVADELRAVADRGLACPDLARRQIDHYRAAGYRPARDRAARCGFLVRRNTEQVAKFNESWWAQVQAWTHRDQLSFGWVAQQSPIEVRRLPVSERAEYVKKHEHAGTRPVFVEMA